MKEFIEKLIARLEEEKKSSYIHAYTHGIEDAISIVNELAEEMGVAKNAITTWIPCSERLPDKELIDVICCFKNGNVSVLLYQGGGRFENVHGIGLYNTKQVIAWQPLPQPYVPKGE